MNKIKLLFLGILLVLPVLLIVILIKFNQGLEQPIKSSGVKTFYSQTSNQGEVGVSVQPLQVSVNQEIKFQLSLDTHSVELAYDLKQISKLYDNLGNIYEPLSWDGGQGGHHLSGTLIFSKLDPQARSIELKISALDGIDRNFKWEL